MKHNLTKSKLDEYLVSNGNSYHKFLKKFNEKGSFFSFNWSALFFAPIWASYRKVWVLYGMLLMYQILIVVFYFLTESSNAPMYLKNIINILMLLFAVTSVFMTFFANSMLLNSANKSRGNERAKSSWLVILVSSVVFFIPIGTLFYSSYYPDYIEYQKHIAYLKDLPKKEVSFRIGAIKPKENMDSGFYKKKGEMVYFKKQAFLTDKHIVNANITFLNGRPNLMMMLNEDGREILKYQTKNNLNKFIIILFESKPFIVARIKEELNTQSFSVPVENVYDNGDFIAYLGGRAKLKNEHTNFLTWLINNL